MFRDTMVDLETTGLLSGRHAIIQIGAVKFDLERMEIGESFVASLAIPPHLSWNVETRNWWGRTPQQEELLQSILKEARPPAVVLQEFIDFVLHEGKPRFWAKPSHFDWPFLQAYCHDFNLPMPFFYRDATDVNSFIRARYFPDPAPEMEMAKQADAHHALSDCFFQIELLMQHYDATRRNAANAIQIAGPES